MNIKLSIYVLWFLLINITFVLGQNEDLHFSYEFLNYTIEDGLPSNETYSIIQDNEGYLWISTDNGVSKYNGYEFENFTTEDGLIDNTIFKMFKDDKGRIWMPGYNGKLCYYENGKFIAYKYNNVLDSLQGLLKNKIVITDINVKDDNVFINFNFGYLLLNQKGIVLKNEMYVSKSNDFKVLDIVRNENNYYLNKFFYNGKITNFSIEEFDFSIEQKYEGIYYYPASFNCKNKTVLSYLKTIYYKDFNSFWQSIELDDYIYSVFFTDEETIFACTDNGIVEIKNGKVVHAFLEGNKISTMNSDENKGLWFASTNKGIFYLPNINLKKLKNIDKYINELFAISYKYKDNVVFKSIYTNENFKISKNSVKVESNEIDLLKLDSMPFYYDLTLKSKFIYSGNILKEQIEGASAFQYLNNKFIYANRGYVFINDFVERSNFYIDIKGTTFVEYLKERSILIGTDHGAFITNHKKRKKIILKGYDDIRVKYLNVYNNDTIITTKSIGLFIKNNKGVINYNAENSSLLSNIINHVYKDDSIFWLGTSLGLNKLIIKDGRIALENILNKYQGLLSQNIRQVLIYDNVAYLGTDNGLYKYDIDLLKQKTDKKPILKSIYIKGEEVNILKLENLKYNENDIKINFEAISFSHQGDITYKYKVVGLFDEWQYTKERYINLFQLNSGKYEVLVSYQMQNMDWSNNLSIKINIEKPFWKTFWFISFLFVFIVVSLLLVFFDYKKRQQLKFDSYQSIQMALAAQMNPHFVFNALNSLQNYILKNESDLAQNYLIKFARLIRIVFENSKKSFIPLSYELEALSLYISLEQKRFDIEFVYELQNEFEQQEIFVPPLIIQPFVENAIWHGLIPKDGIGLLKISIKSKNEKVVIEISDNGIGYSASKSKKKKALDKHRNASGLSKTFERIRLLEKQYNVSLKTEITDLPNFEGTLIKIELPKFINDPKV